MIRNTTGLLVIHIVGRKYPPFKCTQMSFVYNLDMDSILYHGDLHGLVQPVGFSCLYVLYCVCIDIIV